MNATQQINAAITKEAIGQFFAGRKQVDPRFAAQAASFDGWQERASQALQARFAEFLGLLTLEQLAEVASGRVNVAELAKLHA